MDKPALVYEPIEKPSRGNSTCAWILVFTPFWVHEVLLMCSISTRGGECRRVLKAASTRVPSSRSYWLSPTSSTGAVASRKHSSSVQHSGFFFWRPSCIHSGGELGKEHKKLGGRLEKREGSRWTIVRKTLKQTQRGLVSRIDWFACSPWKQRA